MSERRAPATSEGAASKGRAVGEFHWLLQRFLDETPGLLNAAVVSCDGVLLARAAVPTAPASSELTAPIASGLAALADAGAQLLGTVPMRRTVVEMRHCVLAVVAMGGGSLLAVSATAVTDRAVLGYEMTRLVRRVGQVLTPELRDTLREGGRAGTGTSPTALPPVQEYRPA